jgi:hypothetical protein
MGITKDDIRDGIVREVDVTIELDDGQTRDGVIASVNAIGEGEIYVFDEDFEEPNPTSPEDAAQRVKGDPSATGDDWKGKHTGNPCSELLPYLQEPEEEDEVHPDEDTHDDGGESDVESTEGEDSDDGDE